MTRRKTIENPEEQSTMVGKTVEDVLANKGHVAYQCNPDFPYVIHTMNLLAKHFTIPEITFAQLEEALDVEDPGIKKVILQKPTKSQFLENLYVKLLKSCRRTIRDNDINASLYGFIEQHLYYFPNQKNPFGEVKYEADVTTLTSDEKLKVLIALLNEKMNYDAQEVFDAHYSPDELRLEPITVDKKNRKFWYFGDTYLFMESESSKNKRSEPKSTSSKVDLDESMNRLHDEANSLPEFCIVAKTYDDWAQLVAAYEIQRNAVDKAVAEVLKEKSEIVKSIERKRLKVLNEVIPGSRASSRIKQKEAELEEKKKKQLEEERLLDEILQTRKRRQEEAENQKKEEIVKISREERLRRRQQILEKQLYGDFSMNSEPSSSRNSEAPQEARKTSTDSNSRSNVSGQVQAPPAKRLRLDKVVIDVENLASKKANGGAFDGSVSNRRVPSMDSSNETATSRDRRKTAHRNMSEISVDIPRVSFQTVLKQHGSPPARSPTTTSSTAQTRLPPHVLYSNPQAQVSSTSRPVPTPSNAPTTSRNGSLPLVASSMPRTIPVSSNSERPIIMIRQKPTPNSSSSGQTAQPVYQTVRVVTSSAYLTQNQPSTSQHAVGQNGNMQQGGSRGVRQPSQQQVLYKAVPLQVDSNGYATTQKTENVAYYTSQGQYRVIRSPDRPPARFLVKTTSDLPSNNGSTVQNVVYSSAYPSAVQKPQYVTVANGQAQNYVVISSNAINKNYVPVQQNQVQYVQVQVPVQNGQSQGYRRVNGEYYMTQ